MKKISRVSTIISAIMLLTYIIVLISIWSRIPDTVPTHFNAAGVADSYGSKRNLVFEPVLAAFLLLFLSLMERIPAIWNFPVAVTEENRERLYKIAMIMMGGIKVLVTALLIDVGVSSLVEGYPIWPMYMMLGVMIILIIVSTVQMVRAKQCGIRKQIKTLFNAIKLGVRGFVRICIETCARGCFGAWKYRFRKKGMLIRQMLFICQK